MQNATEIKIGFSNELGKAEKQQALIAISHALASFDGMTVTVADPDAPEVTEPVGVKKKTAKKTAKKKTSKRS